MKKKYISLLIGASLLFNMITMPMAVHTAASAEELSAEESFMDDTEDSDFPAEEDLDFETEDTEDAFTEETEDSEQDNDEADDSDSSINIENPGLFILKEKTNDPKIVTHSLEKDVLQNDVHTLTLKNITSDMTVSFKSSDTDILSVKKVSNTSCKYIGLSTGSAQIIVSITISNGFLFFFDEHQTLKTTISVTPHAASVKIRSVSGSLKVGQSRVLKLIIRPSISKEVPAFESSNPKVASVNARGKVSAKKAGTAFITATLENGKSAKCKISVVDE